MGEKWLKHERDECFVNNGYEVTNCYWMMGRVVGKIIETLLINEMHIGRSWKKNKCLP